MTKAELFEVATKVRISLDSFDHESLLSEFNEIQDFITNIEHVSIPSGTPLFEHPLISQVQLRKDDIEKSFEPSLILSNAPEVENGGIVVPKVL